MCTSEGKQEQISGNKKEIFLIMSFFRKGRGGSKIPEGKR
jgi:hypothetical protein